MAKALTALDTIMAELFYVIGASGVGKDSLLNYARQFLKPNSPVVFAHRYITRPADAGGENHVALSESEFNCRSQMGCFAMEWYSHKTCYGIGIEINQWLAKGLNVVVNGSRAYLDEAAEKYPEMVPILLTASSEKLRERLLQRGRESLEEIEERLILAKMLDEQTQHPRLSLVSNNGELGEAGSELVRLIQGDKERVCA